MKNWILATRPQTLPAGIGPVILGLALASTQKHLDILTAVLTLMCTMLLQISSNLINDYYDGVKGSDTDERLGPMRVTSSGLIKAEDVKKGFMFTLFAAFLLGVYLMWVGGLPIVVIGLLSLFCAWAYTGGPFPLSYFALGEVFALLFFGPVAVWGTYYLQLGSYDWQYDQKVFVWGLSVGLISSALMAINNLRDIDQDLASGKKTLPNILGAPKARGMILVFILVGIILAYQCLIAGKFLAFLPALLFIHNWHGIIDGVSGRKLNDHLALTGKYLFVFSLTMSIVIVKATYL